MTQWPVVRLSGEPDDDDLRVAYTALDEYTAPDYVIWSTPSARRAVLRAVADSEEVVFLSGLWKHPHLEKGLRDAGVVSTRPSLINLLEDTGYDPHTLSISARRKGAAQSQVADGTAGGQALELCDEILALSGRAEPAKGISVMDEGDMLSLADKANQLRSLLIDMLP